MSEPTKSDKETRLMEIERNHNEWTMERKKKIASLIMSLVDDGFKYKDLSEGKYEEQDIQDVTETMEAMKLDLELNH